MYFIFNRYFAHRPYFFYISEISIVYLTTLFLISMRLNIDLWSASLHFSVLMVTLIISSLFISILSVFGLYSRDFHRAEYPIFSRLIKANAVAVSALFCLYALSQTLRYRSEFTPANILIPSGFLILWRFLLLRLLNLEKHDERVLIIGSGKLAEKIGKEIFKRPDHGLQLVGFVDGNPEKIGKSIVNPGVIGGYEDITGIVKTKRINRIIVALSDRRAKLPMPALLECKMKGVTIEDGQTFEERLDGKIPVDELRPSWMVFSDGFQSLRSRKVLKRMLDLFYSVILLILAGPIMLIFPALIKLDSKGPIIFRQKRVGENGKEFEIYKFRSMKNDAELNSGPVWAEKNDKRVTGLGNFMRKTRIDELPQIFNVIKGDMSFVGPRPERSYFVEELKKKIPYYELRTVVKPGLTGWTQIKYPYGASVEDAVEKLQYDLFYIKNMSPALDLVILLRTVYVVLMQKGAR